MVFEFEPGDSPLLISVPHSGTAVSEGMEDRMTEDGKALVDTDWHVHRLYEFSAQFGAGLLRARYSRYVVDLNRPPDDTPLYSGPGTGLVPVETFSGRPLYRPGQEPDEAEKARRTEQFWQPYHQRIADELDRIQARFGHAVLLDAHSIAARVPRLFEGRLPDLNLGTNGGASCHERLAGQAEAALTGSDAPGPDATDSGDFSYVRDGRFRGGFITRNFGRPDRGQHALQLELAQECYMDETRPQEYDPARARALVERLRRLVAALIAWRPQS